MSQLTTNMVADGQTAVMKTRGKVLVQVVGSFGGGALELQAKDPATVWRGFGSISADGLIEVDFPETEDLEIRTDLTGSTTPNIDVWVHARELVG